MDENQQQDGITFIWHQKRSCEAWPEMFENCTIDMSKYDPVALTRDCPADIVFPEDDDGGGCVINDGVRGPCEQTYLNLFIYKISI